MKTVKIPCNQCGRKVKDTFQDKWDHVIQFHPQVPLAKMFDLLLKPEGFERFGEWLGNALRGRLNGIQ